MYGFNKELDLSHLKGCEVVRVSIDKFNFLIELDPQNTINTQGSWKLMDDSGRIVDEGVGEKSKEKEDFRIHKILGEKIDSYHIVDSKTLNFVFSNNWILQYIDDSDQYESMSISPNIYI